MIFVYQVVKIYTFNAKDSEIKSCQLFEENSQKI